MNLPGLHNRDKRDWGKNEQSLSDLCKNDKKDLILNTLKGEENQNGT